jgi:hypothetical protein
VVLPTIMIARGLLDGVCREVGDLGAMLVAPAGSPRPRARTAATTFLRSPLAGRGSLHRE